MDYDFKRVFTYLTWNGECRIDIKVEEECDPPRIEMAMEYSPNDRTVVTLELQEALNLAKSLASLVKEVEGK